MPGMYKDAKDWLKQGIQDGVMEPISLLSFVLQYTTNDDIETYFGVSMEDPDENPGADQGQCFECSSEADLEYLEAHDGLCETCVDDQAEEAKEKRNRGSFGLIYLIYRIYMEQPFHLTYEGLQEMVESLEEDLKEDE